MGLGLVCECAAVLVCWADCDNAWRWYIIDCSFIYIQQSSRIREAQPQVVPREGHPPTAHIPPTVLALRPDQHLSSRPLAIHSSCPPDHLLHSRSTLRLTTMSRRTTLLALATTTLTLAAVAGATISPADSDSAYIGCFSTSSPLFPGSIDSPHVHVVTRVSALADCVVSAALSQLEQGAPKSQLGPVLSTTTGRTECRLDGERNGA
jgi:hypothetical protein